MEKKILHYVAFLGLALVFGLSSVHAECGSIIWGMQGYPNTLPAWVPIMQYVDCNTNSLTSTSAAYSGVVHNALVGSEVNLGPSGTNSDYTPGELVKKDGNRFECGGWAGSSGYCERTE